MPLKIVPRPKSPYWIIRGTLRGIRLEESTGTDDKKAAEEIRAKREAEILTESVYGCRATATFASAALSYLENGGSKRFLAASSPSSCLFSTLSISRRAATSLSWKRPGPEQERLDAGAFGDFEHRQERIRITSREGAAARDFARS